MIGGLTNRQYFYLFFNSRFHAFQTQKTKLLSEVEAMLTRYLNPITKQLDNIYIRVAKMERQIQEIGI